LVSDKPAPAVFVEIKDGSSIFPLYLYPDQSTLGFDDDRRPNLSPTFLKALGDKLQLPLAGEYSLPQGLSPEDIFYYAYAIFHAPGYRSHYAEFLKTDFPRLPLTSDLELFHDLAACGQELVALHLLDAKTAGVLDEPRHRFEGQGSGVVEKVEYFESELMVKINATQRFENVPRAVWEFRVGGYQVAEKWLKDRKGRVLSYDDITHYARVLIALAETIRLMSQIDQRIGEFPLA
jgi:predicted helicase